MSPHEFLATRRTLAISELICGFARSFASFLALPSDTWCMTSVRRKLPNSRELGTVRRRSAVSAFALRLCARVCAVVLWRAWVRIGPAGRLGLLRQPLRDKSCLRHVPLARAHDLVDSVLI